MYDLPHPVVCRCLTPCIVKILEEQWFLRYSDEKWKEKAREALSQASKADESICEQISDFRRIINLRNVIVHGYASVEDETIWGILQDDVPKLKEEVESLL